MADSLLLSAWRTFGTCRRMLLAGTPNFGPTSRRNKPARGATNTSASRDAKLRDARAAVGRWPSDSENRWFESSRW
jgi:hypothetical protein